jgi:hypothetical protein
LAVIAPIDRAAAARMAGAGHMVAATRTDNKAGQQIRPTAFCAARALMFGVKNKLYLFPLLTAEDRGPLRRIFDAVMYPHPDNALVAEDELYLFRS